VVYRLFDIYNDMLVLFSIPDFRVNSFKCTPQANSGVENRIPSYPQWGLRQSPKCFFVFCCFFAAEWNTF